MASTTPQHQPARAATPAEPTGCPYYQRSQQACLAAAHLGPLETFFRAGYCAGDDYDDCPLFLCQALRSSRSQGLVRESITMSGK